MWWPCGAQVCAGTQSSVRGWLLAARPWREGAERVTCLRLYVPNGQEEQPAVQPESHEKNDLN